MPLSPTRPRGWTSRRGTGPWNYLPPWPRRPPGLRFGAVWADSPGCLPWVTTVSRCWPPALMGWARNWRSPRPWASMTPSASTWWPCAWMTWWCAGRSRCFYRTILPSARWCPSMWPILCPALPRAACRPGAPSWAGRPRSIRGSWSRGSTMCPLPPWAWWKPTSCWARTGCGKTTWLSLWPPPACIRTGIR